MKRNPELFNQIWKEASEAGHRAVREMKPITPMVVQQHASVLDDNSPVVQEWVVPDGPCGFAWVNVKPGNSAFARWLKEKEYARKDSYYGGVTYWIGEFGQSIRKKEEYAYAFANVLRKYDIRAYASSRMD